MTIRQPGIERKQVETLATCAYIREHATVLLQGPPGDEVMTTALLDRLLARRARVCGFRSDAAR